MGSLSARALIGSGLICAQPAVLWVPALEAADPRLPMALGLPLAAAGGYVLATRRALLIPCALAVAGATWLYLAPPPEHTDPGILDPVFLAAFYISFSVPPVALGISAARRRWHWWKKMAT
jgi:hypothetical protein